MTTTASDILREGVEMAGSCAVCLSFICSGQLGDDILVM